MIDGPPDAPATLLLAHGAGAPMDSPFMAAMATGLAQRGWRVVNVDLTLLAEAPRIGAHREAIGRQVAQLLGIAPDAVNLKATTTERLGFVGRGEGLAAQATVLLAAVG